MPWRREQELCLQGWHHVSRLCGRAGVSTRDQTARESGELLCIYARANLTIIALAYFCFNFHAHYNHHCYEGR